MYIGLVFAVLLTAPATVCAGVFNDAYSYEDNFENSLGLDMAASSGFAISDGKLVSNTANAKAVSECITLPQPESGMFLGWSCLKIDLENAGDADSLAIKTCDGNPLKTADLSTGDNTIDLSDINAVETDIRLEWSTSQIEAKANSWNIYGKAEGATVIDVVANTDSPDAGDTITFMVSMASSGAVTRNPVLRFSLDDINGLHTPDIDDGLAEDAEVDYGSGVKTYRPLEFVSASNGQNGEVPAAPASGAVSGEVVWNLDDMSDGFYDNVTVALRIPNGYINNKTLAARATLEHGVSSSACNNRMTENETSGLVTVLSVRGQYQSAWYLYRNVAPGIDNIYDHYYLYNTKQPSASNSDIEDVTVTITGIGSCTPLFNKTTVRNKDSYQVVSKPERGDPITAADPLIIHFDRIDFYVETARIWIHYDVPDSCSAGNDIGTQSELVCGNPAWNDTDKRIHNIVGGVGGSCRKGGNFTHRVMSGNDPENYYKWPGYNEYLISGGSLRAGEYFTTHAPYGSGNNETHTISLNHSYNLIEIPEGVTFHGIRSSKWTTRLYKDCTGTAPAPADAGFDHNADAPHPGWKPVNITWSGVPFSNSPDETDPEAVAEPGCRLLGVKDNDNPAWQGPDYGNWSPLFLWRVCDGSYDCDELPEETAMSLVGGDIYTYETVTDPAGAVHDCPSYNGSTLYKESKSWPKIYAWPEQNQAPAGQIAHIIVNPENRNHASQYVDGRWAVNLYNVRDYIDLAGVTGEVLLTSGLHIPKPDQNIIGESCDIADAVTFHFPDPAECMNAASADDDACMAWWDVPDACQPPNGWGYRESGSHSHDSYVQMYRFRLNAPILQTTPANTVLDFIAEVRTNDLGARGADNAVDPARWPAGHFVANASVTVLEIPGLDITKTGPVNRKAGDLFTYNLELTNTGNTPNNGWYFVDRLPKDGVNQSEFTPEYCKVYIDRPAGDVIAEYSQDNMCFADPFGVPWLPVWQGLTTTSRTGFQAETKYNINAEAKCIRLRKNPDSQWDFNPGDKIVSALDFEIPGDAPEGQQICNRALTGASADFGATSDIYPVETVNVCTEVNDGVIVDIEKKYEIFQEGIKWKIKVWNASGTLAENITVTDDLPDTMNYQGIDDSLPSGWTVGEQPAVGTSGGRLTIIIDELSPDDGNPESGSDEGSFTFLTGLPEDTSPGTSVTNCATATPQNGLGSKSCASTPSLEIDLGKTKIAVDRASGTPETELFPGDEFSYVITATNSFSQGVFLRITDTLDSYLNYVGNTFTVNGAAASDTFFSDGTLDYRYPEMVNPGETLPLKFKVKVRDTALHGQILENRALVIPCTDWDNPTSCSIAQQTPVVYAMVVDTQCDFDLKIGSPYKTVRVNKFNGLHVIFLNCDPVKSMSYRGYRLDFTLPALFCRDYLKIRANRGQVQLTWTPGGIYDVYSSVEGPDSDYERIATGHVTDWATYLDRNVETEVTYYYYVVNNDGCRSEVVNVTPRFISDVPEIINLDEDGGEPVTPPGSPDEDGDNPVNSDDDAVNPSDDGDDDGNTATVTVVPSLETVKPGDKFQVEVRIDGENIWAAHVDVTVAPDTLQLTSKGGYDVYFNLSKSFKIPIVYDAAAGSWRGALSLKHPAAPVSGEGVFAKKLTYKVLAGKYGPTPITVTATLTDKDGNTLPSQTVNGEIVIDDGIHGGDIVLQGTVNYTDSTPAAGIPVTISIDGHEYTVMTDENGHYQFDDLQELSAGESYQIEAGLDGFVAEGTVTAENITGASGSGGGDNPTVDLPMQLLNTKLADLNKDGKIDIADLTLLANAYGTATGQTGFDERADINKDGKVNIADLAMLGGYWKI